MAGIEKVCEYSGEYCGWDMYGWKNNLIQVKPEYRPLFRCQKHELIVFKPELYWEYPFGGHTHYHNQEWGWYEPPFHSEEEFISWKKRHHRMRFVNEWDYVLIVPGLQGRVGGEYMNHTYHLPTVKRKMKRLLRCKELNIKYLDMSYGEWWDSKKDG